MVKQARAKKLCKLGTGKVTPKQIAFIVDRYLSDNRYSATLSSFRAEASDLLPTTYDKVVPKGLMGLSDILNDYILLKEQRLAMDREKQRVDKLIKEMQDSIRLYQSDMQESSPSSLATFSPQNFASPTAPFLCASNPTIGFHRDSVIPRASTINNSKPPLPPPKACDARYSAPAPTQLCTEKRRASKLKGPPSPKKLRAQPHSVSNIVQGTGSTSRDASTSNKDSPALSEFKDSSTKQAPVKGLSVVKELFKHPESYEHNTSSPKTPQSLASQTDKSLSGLENSAITDVERSCSVISSETIIISPLKNKGYYAVERSYQVKCSPVKTTSARLGNRENVKGRLDFENIGACESVEATPSTAVVTSTPSPSDVETSDGLDFDIPDFEIFDGDFLSGLLVDFDQGEGLSGCHYGDNGIMSGPQLYPSGQYQVANQGLPDCSSPIAACAGSEGIRMQGYGINFEDVVMT